ncbi:hypothetical protein [Rubellicoccus peritrichatus]|uniref:Alpha-L-rhamnosidase six-hairpin glycosidase domain-containing protein n=1 Tax=Rubellicoccus peritrichatus TaxID=3080537 RepID=A0AAQ3QUB3_9BACT|nr:hypothetical protein [Puniceicoccus sp. CR14]WOO40293.1 hypothetical protein RZN69_16865 [Puniceicoccus sp. CR14]
MEAYDYIKHSSFISTGSARANSFSGFLREFYLKGDEGASLAITADTHYKLYVNGCFVNAGPAPFRRPIMRVDEYDISDYMNSSLNRVFVLTRFIGTDVKYNIRGEPGFIAVIKNGEEIIKTDCQWRAFDINAWECDAPNITWALPPMESVDMALPTYKILSLYAQEDYKTNYDQIDGLETPVQAREPKGIQFERRRVPLLHWQKPKAPVLRSIFRTNNEVHNLRDTPLKLDREYMEPAWDAEAYDVLDERQPVLCKDLGEPGYALLYDALRMTAGDFSIEIEADEVATVEIATAERLIGNRPFISRNGSYYLTRLMLTPGVNRYRLYAFSGFRYIFFIAKKFKNKLKINKLCFHECSSDLNYRDYLELDDRAVSTIYSISRRSIQLTTQASCYDCNTREQGSYWGDGLWVTDMIGHMTGDFSHMRELCIAMTGEYRAIGTLKSSLYGFGPPMLDYCMIAVEVMRRYARYTADWETVHAHLPTCEAIVSDFRASKDEAGFVSLMRLKELKPEPYEDAMIFLDHSGLGWHSRTTTGISRNEPNAGLNLFYLLALQALCEIHHLLGKSTFNLDEEISSLRNLCKEKFFDIDAGLVVDSTRPNEDSKSFSQIVNALAIITSVLEGNTARQAIQTVIDVEQFPWVSQGTPYTYFYLIEALGETNQAALGYTELRNRWLPMVKAGATTTWETFLGENSDSLNHAWSAPLPYFARRWLAGVYPLTHGYSSVGVRPDMSFRLKAKVRVMIPQGSLQVAWVKDSRGSAYVEIVLPENVTGYLFCGSDSYSLRAGINKFCIEENLYH